MALDGLHLMTPSESPIPIHLEGDVPWHGTVAEGAEESLTGLLQSPLNGRGAEDPFLDL